MEPCAVVPFDKSDAARIQTVSSQIHPFGWNDVRNAPVASVAEKQHKTFRVRIDGKMISREAAQTDGARAHPVRHFAESLQRMLGKTEIPQILTIGAVSVAKNLFGFTPISQSVSRRISSPESSACAKRTMSFREENSPA